MSFFYPGWTYLAPGTYSVSSGGMVSLDDKKVNCTCGAVASCAPYPATGHSDYCDINNPPPDTEELPF